MSLSRTLLVLGCGLLLPLAASAQFGGKVEIQETATAAELRAAGKGFVESITIHRPPAARTLPQLAVSNPSLPTVFPDLRKMLETAKVSDLYADLYRRKLAYLKDGSSLTDHNYLDCATVLLLEHPVSQRRCILLQADMDVVTDGTDPDRAPNLSDYDTARTSDWFLPQTAYTWAGPPRSPNPFLEYYPAAVARLDHYRSLFLKEAETDKGRIWRFLITAVDAQKARMKTAGLSEDTIRGLKTSRSLLGTEDPFVVLPMNWFSGSSSAWSPRMGDYAAVIYKNTIYPAIVGEAGPTFKAGEASLRLARTINPAASGKERAVSTLGVTYLIFPQTADPRSAPDLARWEMKVKGYLEEIGAVTDSSVLHSWVGPAK
ncbi:MAG: glycoside hydrolase family 75 protein [Terrimicrobiaceae bacterium]